MLKLISPANGSTVSLRGDRVRLFFDLYNARESDFPVDVHPWTNVARDTDGTHPAPVLFLWNTDAPTETCDFAVHISHDPDFSDDMVTVVPDSGTALARYNLEIGKKYYWYAESRGSRPEKSEVFSFKTADEFPRFVYLSKENTNMRDAGGLYNIDGKRVRQGLFYRGALIDKDRTPDEEGFRRLIEELRIRTDLDLKGFDYEANNSLAEQNSKLRGIVDRYIFNASAYDGGLNNDGARGIIADVFRLMCDESIYPAYLHCHSGMDRTGTIMFLLGLILRIDVDTLMIDYELSALCTDGWGDRTRENLSVGAANEIRKFGDEGDDLYACAEKLFDKGFGLPDAPAVLRKIFLED